MNSQPIPEFSRPLRVAELSGETTLRRIEADAGERAALAKRFGLVSLDSLIATVSLDTQSEHGMVRVHGEFSAEVVQTCVVTLEWLSNRLQASFERLYGPPESGADTEALEDSTTEVSPDAEEPPEPFVDGAIDIGEAVAEQLAVELDPFPRAPGAVYQGQSSDSDDRRDVGKTRRPFANLRDLMGKTE